MADDKTNPPTNVGGTSVTSAPTTGIRPITAVTTGTRIIGTYEIEKLINTGGMGEVYRGRNIHDGEPVAIKIVLPHLAQDEMITQLFQKEAKVLNRLVHDAIVRYYVFTNDPDIGRPCMIMEFIEGTSMNDVLKQGPMAMEDVKLLLRRLASGLDKAHAMGVVHRDLSPDNVILQGGSVEHAKIIDFGIAKSTMKGDATLLQGQFAGKFSYVAPEQLGAYGGNVDGRADIYSLALMMVAMAQGRVLNMGKSIVEAVRARGAVPDLSGVYPELRPLLSHMLEPDPENRPGTMAEVIRLLDNPAEVPDVAEPAEDDPDRTRIVQLPKGGLPIGGPTQALRRGGAQITGSGADDALFLGIPDKKAAPVPEPKKGGKGGLVVVLLAVVVLAGGAGAWFSGLFDPKPPTEPPTQVATGDTPVPADPPPPNPPPGDPIPAEPPTTVPTPAPADPTPAEPEPEPEPTPQPAPEPAPEPEPEPAQPASPLDRISQQVAWLRSYDSGPCSLVQLLSSTGDLVAIEGFGTSVDPFSALLSAFTAAHGVEPDIGVRIVNPPQCPVVEFAASARDNGTLPARIVLDNRSDVLKSGETVAGRIEGLAGRSVALFLVNGTVGATNNLKPFMSRASDGSTSFSFSVNLAAGAEPTPQLLMAIVTDTPMTKLDAVPNGVTARTLVPFIATELAAVRQQPAIVLRHFRLEN
ncbi:MAG: serine/threonine-protein kinase [Gemmobacter sp.]